MTNYVLIIFWIALCAVLPRFLPVQKRVVVAGHEETRFSLWWAVSIFLPIIVMAGTRTGVGDTGNYIHSFNLLPNELDSLWEFANSDAQDKGFGIISRLFKSFWSANANDFLFFIAVIQGVILILMYKKYSTNFLMSVFFFVASADYVAWMFNGIRQFMAATIAFLALPLLVKQKIILPIIIIFAASTIHMSALFVLPFVFICRGEAWNRKTFYFIAGTILVVIFTGQFTSTLDTLFQETQYSGTVQNWTESGDDGTNLFRVLFYSIPAVFSYIGRDKIRKINNPILNLCTNMSIVAAGFYVISMFTSGIYVGRIPIYFSLYSYILLPWLLENSFNEKSRRIVYPTMIGSYLFLYIYQMQYTWGRMLW